MGNFSSTSPPNVRIEPSHPLPKRFEIIQYLGEGGSAVVLKCFDTLTNQDVAVKFAKGKHKLKHEAKMMKYLMKHNLDQQNVIKFLHSFNSNSCLVFEMCDVNLKDYIKEKYPMKLQEIRTVIQQLATALEGLRKVKVIHSDLKTNNIMVVNRRLKPLQVKLIDFGLALYTDQTYQHINQCIFYKAPELILGLPYSSPLDIWSLGCVMGKMLLNCVLFPGNTEYENLCYFTDILGPAPDCLLDASLKGDRFYKPEFNKWILKSPVEYWGREYHKHKKSLNFRILHQAKMSHLKYEKLAATEEKRECIALLKAMLRWDAKKRITPKGILNHSFIVRKSNSPRSRLPDSCTSLEQEPCSSQLESHSEITSQNTKDVKGKRTTFDIAHHSKDFDKKLPPRPSISQASHQQYSSPVQNKLLSQKRDDERPRASTTLEHSVIQEELEPHFIIQSALTMESGSHNTHSHTRSKQNNFFESICLCWRQG